MTTAAGTTRLMICENDLITSESLTTLLRQHGYEADQAATGERALEMMSLHRPDACVCDVYLPGMDGLGLVRRVRERQAWRDVPVVLITAASESAALEMAEELQQLQPAALLRKPFEMGALLALLETMLAAAKEAS